MQLGRQIFQWLEVRLGLRELIERQLTGYLLPANITPWHSLGSILLFAFTVQIVTGILLLVYYVPDADKAFASVNIIMNQVSFGWLIRLCHAVGSNLMVATLILHMLSVIFMGSYKSPGELTWLSGFTLLNLVLAVSLTGYLLPWSQLSFWATTVATSSLGAIPFVGETLVRFVRGGELVGPQTLGRFFALHVAVIPAAIAGFIALHLFLIRRTGIAVPPFGRAIHTWTGDRYRHMDHSGGIPFFPHFVIQEMVSISLYAGALLGIVFFLPHIFFPPEAFLPADPYHTPDRIKPEWYFLANYQILKVFPNELAGLAVQGAAMAFLALLPFLDRGAEKHPMKRPLFTASAAGAIIIYGIFTVWGHFS